MANNTISQVEINSETYDILDANVSLRIYPVGSIYMSVNSTSPSTLFGGTWERIQDKFLLAAGDSYNAGDIGGEASHTLSIAELPSHTHTLSSHTHTTAIGKHSHTITTQAARNVGGVVIGGASSNLVWGTRVAGGNLGGPGAAGQTVKLDIPALSGSTSEADYGSKTSGGPSNNTSGSTGNNSAHNNMPPYLVVYIWKRTA